MSTLFPTSLVGSYAQPEWLIDRGRLKEINHRLLLGGKRSPELLRPLVDGFARKTVAHNIRPGARAAVVSISRANARENLSSSIGAWRTWLLKSQYGHFDRQNGQCT